MANERKKLVKPNADFPLTPTTLGYWKKVINGKGERFGTRWCTPEEALDDYNLRRDSIEHGTPLPDSHNPVPLYKALDQYLDAQLKRVGPNGITQRSYNDYRDQCRHILKHMPGHTALHNLGPMHFQTLLDSYEGSPTTITNLMSRAMAAFNWVQKEYNVQLNFGQNFRKPDRRTMRLHRNKVKANRGMPSPKDILLLIEYARNPQIKAMLWLAINCGFGNSDVGKLELETLLRRFEDGWIEYPRPKTGVERAGKLWPESVAALREVIGDRKSGLVFLTKYGNPWSVDSKASAISQEVGKIRKTILKKAQEDTTIQFNPKVSFYDCRRMFQTIGGNAMDEQAVSFIMGHAVDQKMSALYTQGFLDERLIRVSDTVRSWLLGGESKANYFPKRA